MGKEAEKEYAGSRRRKYPLRYGRPQRVSENSLRIGLVSPTVADLRHPELVPPQLSIMASERDIPARQGC